MKKRLVLAVMAAGLLLSACDKPAGPEEHGQDERLFGRSVVMPWVVAWSGVDVQGYVELRRDDGVTWSIGFAERGGIYTTTDWYANGGIIHANNIRRYAETTGQYTAYSGGVTFNYWIDGDTLTLSNGPSTGAFAQFNGKYLYYDIDAVCAEIGYAPDYCKQ
jgi:hypothetical protein